MRGFWIGLAAGMAITAAALGVPRAMTAVHGAGHEDGKAAYRVLLENERVRVREAVFPAGVANTGMHTHEYAHVGVILTKGSLVFGNPDGTSETVAFEPGSVGFREAKATHAVGNPGTAPMRVIEVELK
jgi:oxalate decarboxylase/phosphoglucose isomerase-like protein (cupin superfamily)